MKLKEQLEYYFAQYNQPGFIANDPVQIPHLFLVKQDIEIMGFFAAILAWGQRITIINNCHKLIDIFENRPYDFIKNHQSADLKKCKGFVHRTFNDTDLLSVIGFLQELYQQYDSMEDAFTQKMHPNDMNVENAINGFRQYYEQSESYVKRTAKHIAYPAGGSACKRINMFLRWMVRKDVNGVDFGLWERIKPHQLICPLDIHVLNVATGLGLLNNAKGDWKTAVLLTNKLKKFDKNDPVKYDFALFGMGVNKVGF